MDAPPYKSSPPNHEPSQAYLVAILEKNPVGEASRGGLRAACCNDGMVVGEDAPTPMALGGVG
jgi:hypothetical protein